MLVSVHFPKAAGTSFLELLKQWYGADAVLADVVDDPADPCGRYNLDPEGFLQATERLELQTGLDVVHGHFHPSKYRSLRGATWITWLREPIENLLSIYYYWKKVAPGHGLHRYFLERDLDIVQTAQLPTLRHLMSGVYFGGVDMGRFIFIGRHERLDSDCQRLARLLGKPNVKMPHTNPNPDPSYSAERERIMADARLLERLRDLLADDIRFYERYAR